jgi:hypothetical protein
MDGVDETGTWCGWGVLAHNSVKISGLLDAKDDPVLPPATLHRRPHPRSRQSTTTNRPATYLAALCLTSRPPSRPPRPFEPDQGNEAAERPGGRRQDSEMRAGRCVCDAWAVAPVTQTRLAIRPASPQVRRRATTEENAMMVTLGVDPHKGSHTAVAVD